MLSSGGVSGATLQGRGCTEAYNGSPCLRCLRLEPPPSLLSLSLSPSLPRHSPSLVHPLTMSSAPEHPFHIALRTYIGLATQGQRFDFLSSLAPDARDWVLTRADAATAAARTPPATATSAPPPPSGFTPPRPLLLPAFSPARSSAASRPSLPPMSPSSRLFHTIMNAPPPAMSDRSSSSPSSRAGQAVLPVAADGAQSPPITWSQTAGATRLSVRPSPVVDREDSDDEDVWGSPDPIRAAYDAMRRACPAGRPPAGMAANFRESGLVDGDRVMFAVDPAIRCESLLRSSCLSVRRAETFVQHSVWKCIRLRR